jgi:predicted dienelactone hydrolase
VTSAVRDTRLIVAAVLVVLTLASGCAGQPEQQATRPSVSAASAGPQTRTPAPAPATTAPATAVAAVGRGGSYRTGERQVTFAEPAHAGPAGQYLGQRTLVTQIWYPRARGPAGPFPLLVFAPGFMQCPGGYSDLLRAWASAGYVVAAVNFPRTNCRLGAEAYEADLVNQPRDLSYVLTRLLALSARPGDPFSGLLDPHEVGAAGQSDGGDTVAALAANTCCTDRRLKAVAVLSGAEWPPMPGRYFPGGVPPILFTQGSADTINPPWMSLQLYRADYAGARYYLDLFGASHLIPYQGTNPAERLLARVTLAFFDRYLLGHADALKTMTRDGNVTGTAALVSGGQPPP